MSRMRIILRLAILTAAIIAAVGFYVLELGGHAHKPAFSSS